MFLIGLIFSSLVSNAATPTLSDMRACADDAIDNTTYISKETRASLKDTCYKIQETKRTSQSLRDQANALQNAGSKCSSMMNMFKKDLVEWQLKECQNELKENQARAATLNNDAASLEAKLQTARVKYDDAVSASKDSASKSKAAADKKQADADTAQALQDLKEKNAQKDINKYFDDMNLSIYSAELKSAQASAILNNVARAVDQSALGLYLRDRVAGLLNSDTMCDAVKQCPGKRSFKASDLNSIFNNATNNTTPGSVGGSTSAPSASKSEATKK